jgi:hypothetical protein
VVSELLFDFVEDQPQAIEQIGLAEGAAFLLNKALDSSRSTKPSHTVSNLGGKALNKACCERAVWQNDAALEASARKAAKASRTVDVDTEDITCS